MTYKLPQMESLTRPKRQHMTREGGSARSSRRYTSLVVNTQGRWLCPVCSVTPENAGDYARVLHYFGWQCFDTPPAHAGYRDSFEKFRQHAKDGWIGFEYRQVSDREGVFYYANPSFVWQCLNTATFNQGNVKIGVPCGFSRVNYPPHKCLTHLKYPSPAAHEILVLFSKGVSISSDTDVYSNSHWICMKCLFSTLDLVNNISEIRSCVQAITSPDSGYKQLSIPELYFGQTGGGTGLFLFYVNSFLDGSLICTNRQYGNGPMTADRECGYKFGTILEYFKDPNQYAFMISGQAGLLPEGISPVSVALLMPVSNLGAEESVASMAQIPAPEDQCGAESLFMFPEDDVEMDDEEMADDDDGIIEENEDTLTDAYGISYW